MNTQLLEIHPLELKFYFELKKQSSCAVHLTNLTDQDVAFKVKTTSPKKYCVRPNVGIIKPKGSCDFTVTMQAQKSTMLECKDKFLIQSTVVPYGTNEEDITSSMFSKESLKYVEETKLRVVLASQPNSPTMPPAEVALNRDPFYENLKPHEPSNVFSPVVNKEPSYETLKTNNKLYNGEENFSPDMLLKKVEEPKNDEKQEELESVNVIDNSKLVPADTEEHNMKDNETKQPNDAEVVSSKTHDAEETNSELKIEAEELRSTIATLQSKLLEADDMIVKIKEESSNALHENHQLKQELETMCRRIKPETSTGKMVTRKVHVGFPPLFICMIALIFLFIGAYFF